MAREVAGSVYGGTGNADVLFVGGLVAATVLALDLIDCGVRRAVLAVYLDVSLGKGAGRSAFVFFVVRVLDTGTVVMLLFTSYTDLFFAVTLLSARRKVDRGLRRRVLTFPSGFLLGELDLNLFVGLDSGGLSSLSGLFVFVRRREDAEGNGYSGFKIQIADLYGAKRDLLAQPFAKLRKEDKKIPLALLSII